MKYYLAIDIGASGGRHILGWIEDGRLKHEEVYRFKNGIVIENGHSIWNMDSIVNNVIVGISRCAVLGKIPYSVAIDTWGVDYVLLDDKGSVIHPVYSYRDARTKKALSSVNDIVKKEELYKRTGIQFQSFNTVFQLYCDKLSNRLTRAKYLLMIPDYINYRLTGVMKQEYTNATTSSLVNATAARWDEELIARLGFNKKLFQELSMPKEEVARFSKEIEQKVGFSSKVVLCPSHDTASAVTATLGEKNTAYLSSGTWSLIGIENDAPIITETARNCNFTNEGGIDRRFRFLKNLMGMWIFGRVEDEFGIISYEQRRELAKKSSFQKTFDVNARNLENPKSMADAIRELLHEPELPIGDIFNSIYHSLAKAYKDAVEEVEKVTRQKIEAIQIVGGGGSDPYLNELTRHKTQKRILTGPKEATAIGNLAVQIMAAKGIDLKEARELIRKSVGIEEVL